MAAIAEQRGDGLAVRVVYAQDANGRIGRMIRHFPEKDVAVWIGLPPVHPKGAFAPARADACGNKAGVGFTHRFRDPPAEILLVARLKGDLAGLVGEPLGHGRRAVGVIQVDHDVGGRRAHRFGNRFPQSVHHLQFHPAGIRRYDHDLCLAIGQHQRRGRQVAFDRLDEPLPRTEAKGPDPQRRIDHPPAGAGVQVGHYTETCSCIRSFVKIVSVRQSTWLQSYQVM